MMSKFDWEAEARRVAEAVHENLCEAHRGVIRTEYAGVYAAFGNDGYGSEEDHRARAEVDGAREALKAGGAEILGFGVSHDYSWALLYRGGDLTPEQVNAGLWFAWHALCGGNGDVEAFCQVQFGVAASAIAMHKPTTVLSAN
jgi:hypothetical protein